MEKQQRYKIADNIASLFSLLFTETQVAIRKTRARSINKSMKTFRVFIIILSLGVNFSVP